MIGFLRGKLVTKSAPSLTLDVQGIGYEIDAPMSTFYDLPEPGQDVMLFTHLIIREDSHSLYGFSRDRERSLFRSLIKVNGVGARMALTLLSGFNADAFQQCILAGDSAALVRVPGVGKKTAERLIVEMKDRLPKLDDSGHRTDTKPMNLNPAAVGQVSAVDAITEASSALIALGYKPAEASRMIRVIDCEGKSSEAIIRLALQSMSR